MTILYICDEYPPGMNGGIGTAVQLLSRELVNQGHKVYVVGLYSYYYGQNDYENDNSVEVYRLRYGLKFSKNTNNKLNRLQNKLPKFLQRFLYGKRDYQKYLNFIKILVKTKKIDVIEIPDFSTYDEFLGFAPEIPVLSIPVIVKCHGSKTYFAEELGIPINDMNFKTDELLYKRADSLFSVSQYTASKVQQKFNIQKEIHLMYNGIDISAFRPDINKREKETVIFTGALVEKKGIRSLLLAWNIVNGVFPRAKLLIFGKGKTEHLKQLLSANSLNTVIFKGHVSREVVYQNLSTATLAIFPSYSETFGLAPIEAMSTACPTIFTKYSCGPEIVRDNIDGMLVNPDDINEIAEKIITLINNKNLQQKYAVNGRKAVEERFDIKKSATDHLSLYKQVINAYKI
ncbi:MAG: hypothetical protein BGO87_13275 [Flavobacteriia bacterium 40-80]|nr:MAG: hypothetical protein BGO87_13275 [Flavobacteriia bacterium 40-80]